MGNKYIKEKKDLRTRKTKKIWLDVLSVWRSGEKRKNLYRRGGLSQHESYRERQVRHRCSE